MDRPQLVLLCLPNVTEAREFDLVLFGATGFTGGLVAEHVAKNARKGVRFALAGRRSEVLSALRDRLLAAHPQHASIGVVVADVSDPASLVQLAARTRVVLSTVGPFVDYGEPLVRACVEQGTDYLDSTGERPFVLSMIERYDAAAKARGVRLIFACGFDSVPADMGVYFTVQQVPEAQPIEIASYLSFRGTFSAGTKRSAIKELGAERPGAAAYAFATAARSGRVLKGKAHRARSVGAWVTTFIDAVDSNIVLRSAATIERYGPSFTYTPYVTYPNVFAMPLLMLADGTAKLLASNALIRSQLLKLVEPSGRGPSAEQMAKGWFRLQLEAAYGNSRERRVSTEVVGDDPGYGATSRMLGQSALCLIEDRALLPARSGVVTTAAALGDRLLQRLQAQGIQFRVLS